MTSRFTEALRDRNPITLRFPEPVEREFLEDYRVTSLPFLRVELALGCALNAAFAVWDAMFFPELKYTFWAIRFFIVCPYIAGIVMLTYSARWQKWWQFGAGSSMVVGNTEFLVMMALASPDKAHLYFYPACMYVLTYACVTMKLRFTNAVIVASLVLLGYQITAIFFCDFPRGGLANANFFLFGLAAVGLLAAYMLELYARREFVLRRQNMELLASVEREKAQAEQANSAKTHFLASASHDLRQPLHTIGLLVGALHEVTTETPHRRLAERIRAGVVALENLFNGLLDLSQYDAGMVEAKPRTFALASLIHSLQDGFAAQAEAKRIDLRVRQSGVWVQSDPVLLARIASNLVSNAIRYTQKGGILIGCRRRGSAVELQVLDTGIGIPSSELGRVFEEFYQLANPERDRTKGLGLGLSIVQRYAKLLGHPLGVKSTPGRGSCFSVELPVALQREQSTAEPQQIEIGSQGTLFGSFIVVVDDEQDIRAAMETILETWGCHSLCASSAEDAVRQLEKHWREPDLVISDYRLRDGLDGLDAIDKIRKQTGTAVPAIIITGDISASDIIRIMKHGLQIAHKPLMSEELRALIVSLLSNQGKEPPNETAAC
jgi:signal transduction histidine kinase/CheY-like chemotaxis protein